MPQTRLPRIPDPIGVKGTNGTDIASPDNPVDVQGTVDTGAQLDIFGHMKIFQSHNQVEMRLDASDYGDFTDPTVSGGGSITQTSGVVTMATSTGATGAATLSSKDPVEYRPGVGLYGGGTAVFTAGVAGSTQYVGLGTDLTFTNGVAFGYKGTDFGIRYTRGGVEVDFIAQADWDDPCLGAADSDFKLDGISVALDPTAYGGPYMFEAGLFGYAGWVAKVWSPDNGWIIVHTYKNHVPTPVFNSNALKVVLSATKTSGSTNVTIQSQCWAAGSGSALERLGATLTDRKLVANTRSVISGKTTAGGGGYVDVKVSPSGALAMEAEQATHDNLNANANLQVGDADVGAGNPVPVSADSLPLPTGAATSAKQDTQQTTLDDIKTGTDKIPASPSQEAATGAATPTSVTPVGGTDGTNLQTLRLDSDGHAQVDILSGGGAEPISGQETITHPATESATIELAGNTMVTFFPRMNSGSATVVLDQSVDGVNWRPVAFVAADAVGLGAFVTGTFINTSSFSIYNAYCGSRYIRWRMVSFGATEEAVIDYHITPGNSGQIKIVADAGATGDSVPRVVEANPTAGSTTTATAGATATTALSADDHRISTLISNEGAGTARVAIGGTTPTSSLGEPMLPGDRMVVPGGPEIQVIREGAVDATLQLSEVKHA